MRRSILLILIISLSSFADTSIFLRGPNGQPVQAKVHGNIITDMQGNPLTNGTYQGPKHELVEIKDGIWVKKITPPKVEPLKNIKMNTPPTPLKIPKQGIKITQ